MTERQELHRRGFPGALSYLRRPLIQAPTAASRVRGALLAGSFTLVLLLLVLQVRVFTWMGEYPAVLLVFLTAGALPGYFLQRALLTSDGLGLADRATASLALGLGVVALPGLVALGLHLDLQAFTTMHIALAAGGAGGSTLFFGGAGREPGDPSPASGGRGNLLLATLVLVALGGVLTSPLWAEGRIARDADDW